MNFDYQTFQFINSLAGHYKLLDDLGIFLAVYSQYFIGAGIIIWMAAKTNALDLRKDFKTTAYFFATAIVSRFFFGQILKMVISRLRPAITHQAMQLIIPDSYGSFPSGHMSFFFAFSTAVYYFNKKAGIICFIASFLMGLARIYTGIHYPLDILGGLVLGILVGWGSYKIYKRWFIKENNTIV